VSANRYKTGPLPGARVIGSRGVPGDITAQFPQMYGGTHGLNQQMKPASGAGRCAAESPGGCQVRSL